MQSKLVAEGAGERIFVVILNTGEEAFSTISDFAVKERFSAASLTALGAFSEAVIGWFDPASKAYRKIPVAQQCEVLSALGNIAVDDDGKPSLHVHVVLGLRDGSTRGGHLLEGLVRPTLEVTLVETPAHLRRKKRPELGIALIDLAASS
jgi:predicted DNA-binding protein with PD1-like motif